MYVVINVQMKAVTSVDFFLQWWKIQLKTKSVTTVPGVSPTLGSGLSSFFRTMGICLSSGPNLYTRLPLLCVGGTAGFPATSVTFSSSMDFLGKECISMYNTEIMPCWYRYPYIKWPSLYVGYPIIQKYLTPASQLGGKAVVCHIGIKRICP